MLPQPLRQIFCILLDAPTPHHTPERTETQPDTLTCRALSSVERVGCRTREAMSPTNGARGRIRGCWLHIKGTFIGDHLCCRIPLGNCPLAATGPIPCNQIVNQRLGCLHSGFHVNCNRRRSRSLSLMAPSRVLRLQLTVGNLQRSLCHSRPSILNPDYFSACRLWECLLPLHLNSRLWHCPDIILVCQWAVAILALGNSSNEHQPTAG